MANAAAQANMVTCRPEMDIRWATPVARTTSQSALSIAFWSPTTSAASRPAAFLSGTRASIASRTDWRAPSTGCLHVAPMRRGGGSLRPART